jgi:hypothetical protein
MDRACRKNGEKRNAYRGLVGKLTERDLDVGGMTTLKWILERCYGVVWTGLISLRIGTSGGLL